MENRARITHLDDRNIKRLELLVGITSLIVTLALSIAVILFWDYINQIRHYGYLGIFVLSFFSAGVSFIPIPSLLVVFALGSALHPPIIGICAGLGEALGSMLIYLTGYNGQPALKNIHSNAINKLEHWIHQRGSITVFIMSVIVNPLFLPFTAMAGMLHLGFVKFFTLCLAGKSIKNTVVAYFGFFGLGALLKSMGVSV